MIHLTPVQLRLIRAICTQDQKSTKEIAFDLHITPSTFKLYICRIYASLGWHYANQRMLALWGIAHRKELGIKLPRIQDEEAE